MKKILVLLDLMVFYDREVFRGIKSAIQCQPEEIVIYVSTVDNCLKYNDIKFDFVIIDGDKIKHDININALANAGIIYSSYHLDKMPSGFSSLVVNNEHFSKLAMGKFVELGIDNVGFYSSEFDRTFGWSKERAEMFDKTARAMGLTVHDIHTDSLEIFSKKLGVLCSTDRSARALIQTLADHKIAVPGQVAVIGIDGDPVESDISPVSITSIDINPYEIGRKSFDLLHDSTHIKEHYYYSERIIENNSCSTKAPSDGIVAMAVFFIHNNFHQKIKVTDVASYCSVSRKTLESRFILSMKKTVHQYIHDKRLEKCINLLRDTDESMGSIALQCGYPHQSYLYQIVRKYLFCTPLEFRNKHRV